MATTDYSGGFASQLFKRRPTGTAGPNIGPYTPPEQYNDGTLLFESGNENQNHDKQGTPEYTPPPTTTAPRTYTRPDGTVMTINDPTVGYNPEPGGQPTDAAGNPVGQPNPTANGATLAWLNGGGNVQSPNWSGWDSSRINENSPKYEWQRYLVSIGKGGGTGVTGDDVRNFVAADPRWELDPRSSADDPHMRVKQDQLGTFGEGYGGKTSIYQDVIRDAGGVGGAAFSNVEGDPAYGYAPVERQAQGPPLTMSFDYQNAAGGAGGTGAGAAGGAAGTAGAGAAPTWDPKDFPTMPPGATPPPGYVDPQTGKVMPGGASPGAGTGTPGAGSPTGPAQDDAWKKLYDELLTRSQQSLVVDPNDPIIKGQVDAATAVANREALKQSQAAAERAGPYGTGEAIAASASAHEAVQLQAQQQQFKLMADEVTARRAEIKDALDGRMGMLTTEQQIRLREIDQSLERRQQDLAAQAADNQYRLGLAAAALARENAQHNWTQMDWERQFRDRGWESDLAQRNFENERSLWY